MEKDISSEAVALDAIDRQLLALLQANAKLGTKELAASVGLTLTPTYERIKRLEKKGVIKGYAALIDKRKQGLGLTVLCNVQLKSHAAAYLDAFEEQIIGLEQVHSCFHIAGNFDYLLKIHVRDMDEYALFVKEQLAKIPHIATLQSSFVMRTMKETY